jgi:hypothetical protein
MRIMMGRAAAVVFFVTVLLLGACSSNKEGPRAGGTSSPTASSPGATTGASVPPGASAKPTSTTTTGAAPTTGTGAVAPPSGAKLFVPRPAGTYTFATSGQTQISGAIKRTYQVPPRTTLAIGASSGGVQRSVRDMRDSDGNGRVTEMRVRTASDGLHLVYLKNTSRFAGVTDVREFTPSPAPLILRTGAPNGDRLSFTLEGSDVRVTTTVEVLRREAISIGGGSIQAVVIKIHSQFSGDVNGTDDATNWLRPSDGLLLREDSRSDVYAGFTRVRTDYSAKLERLTPS